MKLLLDTCISWTVRDALQAAGHDVIWTGDWLKDPGDEEILEYGCRENRILITLDKDFGHSLSYGVNRMPELSAW